MLNVTYMIVKIIRRKEIIMLKHLAAVNVILIMRTDREGLESNANIETQNANLFCFRSQFTCQKDERFWFR